MAGPFRTATRSPERSRLWSEELNVIMRVSKGRRARRPGYPTPRSTEPATVADLGACELEAVRGFPPRRRQVDCQRSLRSEGMNGWSYPALRKERQ